MKTQDMIDVMLAHVNGANVEIRPRGNHSNDGWHICEYPVWNWAIYSYRLAQTEKDQHIEKIEYVLDEIDKIDGGWYNNRLAEEMYMRGLRHKDVPSE